MWRPLASNPHEVACGCAHLQRSAGLLQQLSVPEKQVGFLNADPRRHWSTSHLEAPIRASHAWTTSVSQMDGRGSQPGSSGCSRPTAPPCRATDSLKERKKISSPFASLTRRSSPGLSQGRPQQRLPRYRSGRGPAPPRKRARDHVLHGGPPMRTSMSPSSASAPS